MQNLWWNLGSFSYARLNLVALGLTGLIACKWITVSILIYINSCQTLKLNGSINWSYKTVGRLPTPYFQPHSDLWHTRNSCSG